MSLILLSRLPIPNLRHYCWLSLALFLTVVLYAQKLFYNIKNDEYYNEQFNSTYIQANGYVYTLTKAITSEPWCIWVLINCCYCALLLFSKLLQKMIFGNLRVVEYQHIKDQFWNFIFLKFIFIFGVLNLESANEVGMWCTWFSIIGFLALHSQICKDRFEYLSFSSTTPLWNHIKVIALLNCIICLCMGLIGISVLVELHLELHIGLFMFTEAFALTNRTLYVIAKYGIHLWDTYYVAQWENKGTVSYYVDFVFEIAVIMIEFIHYVHMLIYGNYYLSMANIVIFMELRRLIYDFKKRIKRHTNYMRVNEKMEKRFPWANKEELDEPDKCAVCWDKLDKARKLPCSHMFHHNCLRAWLEQDTSCPTCRLSLQDENENPTLRTRNAQMQYIQQFIQQQQPQQAAVAANQQDNAQAQQPAVPLQPQQNGLVPRRRNLFHFDGSRYVSWLPSFSVEVTHNLGNNLPSFLRRNISEERLNALAQQVLQVFPHIPMASILEDLRQTHSAEITIENILQDRLNMGANLGAFDTDSDDSEASSDNIDDSDLSSHLQQTPVLNESSSILSANESSILNSNSEGLKDLYLRKKELIENSKKRYLSKQQNNSSPDTQPTTSSRILTEHEPTLSYALKNELRMRHPTSQNDDSNNN